MENESLASCQTEDEVLSPPMGFKKRVSVEPFGECLGRQRALKDPVIERGFDLDNLSVEESCRLYKSPSRLD
jgi:hypothetical protein